MPQDATKIDTLKQLETVLTQHAPDKANEILSKYGAALGFLSESSSRLLLDDKTAEEKRHDLDEISASLIDSPEGGKKRLITKLEKKLDEILAYNEGGGDFEIVEMPVEFARLNSMLGLPESVFSFYFQGYMQISEDERIPPEELEVILEELSTKRLNILDPDLKSLALQEAFGRLVNGDRAYPLGQLGLSFIMGKREEDLERIDDKLKPVKKRIKLLQDRISGITARIAKMTEQNPQWYDYFETDRERDPQISSLHDTFLDQQSQLETEKEKQKSLEKERLDNLVDTCSANYQFLVVNGASQEEIDDFVLSSEAELYNDIPVDVYVELKHATERKLKDPNLYDFERLYYEGRYDEAFESIAKQRNPAEYYSIPEMIRYYEEVQKNGYNPPLEQLVGGKWAKEYAESHGLVVMRFGGITMDWHGYLFIKKNPDDSFSYADTQFKGDKPSASTWEWNDAHIQTVSSADATEAFKLEEAQNETMPAILPRISSFKSLSDSAEILQNNLIPLQKLFEAGSKGSKTGDFIELAKSYALKIKGDDSLTALKTNYSKALEDLNKLRRFSSGATSDFDRKILEMETALRQMAGLFQSNQIERFCDVILNPEYEEDGFLRWVVKTGIPFITTIFIATAAMVSFGAGAGLAFMAFVGTVGGMIGNELGTAISDATGELAFDESYENKTLLGKYWEGQKVYNPETGKYEGIEFSDLAKLYGATFVIGFITTFALLGLGQKAGAFLSKFATNYGTSEGLRGSLAKLLSKLPKFRTQEINLAEHSGLRTFTHRLFKEFLQETGEEVKESAAQRLDARFGFFVSLYHCTNGGAVAYKLGKFDVVAESVVDNGNSLETNFSFDKAAAVDFESALKSTYDGQDGFKVEKQADGSFTVTKKADFNTGEKTVTMIFTGTTESLPMKQLLTIGRDSDGVSEAERLYGLRSVDDNSYEFSNAAPEGTIPVGQYLKRHGFVVVGDPATGRFTAVKGDNVVQFTAAAETEADTEVEAASETTPHPEYSVTPDATEVLSGEGSPLNIEGAEVAEVGPGTAGLFASDQPAIFDAIHENEPEAAGAFADLEAQYDQLPPEARDLVRIGMMTNGDGEAEPVVVVDTEAAAAAVEANPDIMLDIAIKAGALKPDFNPDAVSDEDVVDTAVAIAEGKPPKSDFFKALTGRSSTLYEGATLLTLLATLVPVVVVGGGILAGGLYLQGKYARWQTRRKRRWEKEVDREDGQGARSETGRSSDIIFADDAQFGGFDPASAEWRTRAKELKEGGFSVSPQPRPKSKARIALDGARVVAGGAGKAGELSADAVRGLRRAIKMPEKPDFDTITDPTAKDVAKEEYDREAKRVKRNRGLLISAIALGAGGLIWYIIDKIKESNSAADANQTVTIPAVPESTKLQKAFDEATKER